MIIAVETAPVAPDKVTFFEEGRSALDRELDIVRASLSDSAVFAGTSVHYWETFQALAQ